MKKLSLGWLAIAFSGIVLLTPSTSAWAQNETDSNDSEVGLDLRGHANIGEIGLPLYPNALRRYDKTIRKSGGALGLWVGSFRLKVVAIQYKSSDKIDDIADFYRRAMGQYGDVLDCSVAHAKDSKRSAAHALTCDDDDIKPGERIFKVGTEYDQRIVSLKRVGDEVDFDIVRFRFRDE